MAKAVLDAFRLPDLQNRTENDQLVDFLKDRNLLLFLDNCEHLITGCAELVELLLKACPSLHILTTSRIRLNLPGEIVFYVPSLSTPDPNKAITSSEMAKYASIQLFTERSRSYSHGFTINPENALTVANICYLLNGIPLAIELAAARTRMMTVEQIKDQLKDALRLLVGGSQTALPRHRTLQASIEWSYNLLRRKERLLLQRISVFFGGCGLESVEVICAGEEILQNEVLDLLAALVDQSLLIAETSPEGGVRYYQLETVRQYARERLVENCEVSKLFQRHLIFYLQFAIQADQKIRGPQQISWLKQIDIEKSNIFSALERSFITSSSAEMGVQLACALTWYWGMVGNFLHQQYFMKKALSVSENFGRTQNRAKALFHIADASVWGGNFLEPYQEKAFLEKSLEIWRELGKDYILEEAKCMLTLGCINKIDFNDNQGFNLINEGIKIFQNTGNTWWHAWAINIILKIIITFENKSTVRSIFMEETKLWRQIGDRWGEALPLMYWGQFSLFNGEFVEAHNYLIRSLEIFLEFESKGMAYQVLRDLNHAARAQKEYDQAEEYLENCTILIHEIGWNYLLPEVDCARGFIALHKGEYLRAKSLFTVALKNVKETKLKENIILCIAGFAALNVVRDNPAYAARLFGACYSNKDVNQFRMRMIRKKFDFDHFLELCITQIKKPVFDQAWNEGCDMSLDQAVTYAQEVMN